MQGSRSKILIFGASLAPVTDVEIAKTDISFLACGAWCTS